ncbi:MAG: class IV adenylate cyclase [Anaerolineales bacterium]|nr:class IV adenylate cyclase [Anaerolineales bacterium]
MNGQETEVKFYVQDLKKIETRLRDLNAQLIHPRVHEVNYRYDLPDGSLRANGKVLRIRRDANVILTYKGPSEIIDGVFSRTELETTIGDLDTAQQLLGALGYVQILIYEKYRTIYELNDCHIMLDELPYGDFVEIESIDAPTIRKMTLIMGLKFEAAVGAGYSRIFENFNSKYGLPSSDLTFDALRGKKLSPEELNVQAAD